MQLQKFITSTTTVELLCFLTAVVCLSSDKKKIWKYFTIYLFITCVTELFAVYLRKVLHHNNQWPYNIFIIAEVGFTIAMFAELFNKYTTKSRKYILLGSAVLLVTYGIDIYAHGFMFFNNITDNAMDIVFSLYAFFYFYLLLKDDRYSDLRFSPEFWWVMGVFVFYFGSTAIAPYWGAYDTPEKRSLSGFIVKLLNVILYTCWIYSFICKKRHNPTLKA